MGTYSAGHGPWEDYVVGSADSLIRARQLIWPAIYQNRATQLGNTATIVNFGDDRLAGALDALTFTGYKFNASGLAPTWTPNIGGGTPVNTAMSGWSTSFDLLNLGNWKGAAPVLTWTGAESITTPDATYWTRVASAFSIGMWVNCATSATTRRLFNNGGGTGATREWTFSLESDVARLTLSDNVTEGGPYSPQHNTNASIPLNQWVFLVVVDDGTTGATAANGITFYVNGALVASTATNDASFVNMSDGAFSIAVGANSTGSSGFTGKMLGGPFGPCFGQVAWTAAQILNTYSFERLAIGV